MTVLARCQLCGKMRRLVPYAGPQIGVCALCLYALDRRARNKPEPSGLKRKRRSVQDVRAKS